MNFRLLPLLWAVGGGGPEGVHRGFGGARQWVRHRPSLLEQCRPGLTMGSGVPTPRGARVANFPDGLPKPPLDPSQGEWG